MSLFNNKLQKVQMAMLGQDVQDRFANNEIQLAQNANDLNSRQINIKYPPVPLVSCKGDGSNESANLQALIDFATLNKLELYAPAGTFHAENINLSSYLTIKGAGRDNTSFKLVDGSTKDLFITNNFSTLTGTNSNGGVSGVTLENFCFDGNKDNCPSGGWGLKRYGYRWNMKNIEVKNCQSGGIYTEWGTTGSAGADLGFMEDTTDNLLVHDCNYYGVRFRGPHDSRWSNMIIYYITGIGFLTEGTASYSTAGLILSNLHVYACKAGNGLNGDGIVLNGAIYGTMIQSESNDGQGIIVNASSFINGCYVFANKQDGLQVLASDTTIDELWCNGNLQNGVTMGASGKGIAGCNIQGKVLANTIAQFNIVNDLGNNKISAVIYNSGGQVTASGTKSTNSHYELIDSAPSIWANNITANGKFSSPFNGYAHFLRLGGTRLWTDAINYGLRTKGSDPTSELDGFPMTRKVSVPATATTSGLEGDWASDGTYLYICYTANAWRRVAVSAW